MLQPYFPAYAGEKGERCRARTEPEDYVQVGMRGEKEVIKKGAL